MMSDVLLVKDFRHNLSSIGKLIDKLVFKSSLLEMDMFSRTPLVLCCLVLPKRQMISTILSKLQQVKVMWVNTLVVTQ